MAQWNRGVFEWIFHFSHRSFLIDGIGVFLAHYLPYGIVFFLLLFIASRPQNKQRLALLCQLALAAILSRGIMTELIRAVYPQQRPFDVLGFAPLIPESGSGFPSGHAAFFFACAVILLFTYRKWGILLFLLAVINGVARVYVGVHWPIDIVAGMLVGAGSAVGVHFLLRSFTRDVYRKGGIS